LLSTSYFRFFTVGRDFLDVLIDADLVLDDLLVLAFIVSG